MSLASVLMQIRIWLLLRYYRLFDRLPGPQEGTVTGNRLSADAQAGYLSIAVLNLESDRKCVTGAMVFYEIRLTRYRD